MDEPDIFDKLNGISSQDMDNIYRANRKVILSILKKPNMVNILYYLYCVGDNGSNINHISKYLYNSKTSNGTVSKYANLLEEWGYVTSESEEEDSKVLPARVLRLTDKGKKFVKSLIECLAECDVYPPKLMPNK